VRAAIPLLFLLASCASAGADNLGRALFEPCRACHALDPAARGMPGPNLAALIGRRIGSDPNFDYSPVLRKAASENRVWTAEMLERFLADPDGTFPGMWMSARPMEDAGERNALTQFLSQPNIR
jgi:cytochrome c